MANDYDRVTWATDVFYFTESDVTEIAKLLILNGYEEISVFECVWPKHYKANGNVQVAGMLLRLIRRVNAVLTLKWNCPERCWEWLCEATSWSNDKLKEGK